MTSTAVPIDVTAARSIAKKLADRLARAVLGRDEVIELLVIALLADGHVLLEDYPGSGKTTLARALGDALDDAREPFAPFRRIQFTPDLLPSDITGTSVYNASNHTFEFRRGPLFAHVVLADEINRTSPKVQAALLEAMAEKQITADDKTHALDPLFFVVATQNPLDVAGTYPLPTPQLDRFLFKVQMKHIDRDAEVRVLTTYPKIGLDEARALPGVTRTELLGARQTLRERVAVAPPIREALVDLARAIREDERVLQGASTRSLVLFLPALQARAIVKGRDHVTPDDIAALAPYVLAHRLECAAGVDRPHEIVKAAAGTIVERLVRAGIAT